MASMGRHYQSSDHLTTGSYARNCWKRGLSDECRCADSKETRRLKSDARQVDEKGCRLGRRPEKQGPRHQLSNRDWVDKLATERRLKVTKEELSIGTWNVRTLWAAGKLDLKMEMKRYRCDILGIAEMRWTGTGEMDGCSVIWSGDETKHEAGVGFLLNKKAIGAMLGYKPVSDRIIVARFQAQPFNISVIQIYAIRQHTGRNGYILRKSATNNDGNLKKRYIDYWR